MEIVGDDRDGRVRGRHQSFAVLNILDRVERPVLDNNPLGRNPDPYKVILHSLPFRKWFGGAFSARHDADRGAVLPQVIRRRVEAVLEHSAGPVLAHLGPQNDQAVEPRRRPFAKTLQHKPLTDSQHKNPRADHNEEDTAQ